MRTLYIEAKMGAAGDMLMAALYEICAEKAQFLDIMNRLFPNEIKVTVECGNQKSVSGSRMHILIHNQEEGRDLVFKVPQPNQHAHEHTHYSYTSILERIDLLPIPDSVKDDAKAIYQSIAEAESKVHNTPIEQIHFHEVGSLDAIADVVGCALLFHDIKADQIICSPIHVGNGTVRCAHGILPVPAPATAELLKGIPYYTGQINSELCTPTGAAILKHFVTSFGPMPALIVERNGIGLGYKEFEQANLIRIILGENYNKGNYTNDVLDFVASDFESSDFDDEICELSCNIDDMTGEALGYAFELLLEEGALDVYYQSIQMKKNRPGILLHCLCERNELDKFAALILKHTSTRGLRYQFFKRKKLTSTFSTVTTPYGDVRIKHSEGYGIKKSKLEFDDIRTLAKNNHCSIQDVIDSI